MQPDGVTTRKASVSETPWQVLEHVSGQDRPLTVSLPDLLLLIPSIKSEPLPPLSVSRHSSLIGRGFGFDKVSEMTSTMHFIT